MSSRVSLFTSPTTASMLHENVPASTGQPSNGVLAEFAVRTEISLPDAVRLNGRR